MVIQEVLNVYCSSFIFVLWSYFVYILFIFPIHWRAFFFSLPPLWGNIVNNYIFSDSIIYLCILFFTRVAWNIESLKLNLIIQYFLTKQSPRIKVIFEIMTFYSWLLGVELNTTDLSSDLNNFTITAGFVFVVLY
jgi:hypothetical protein